MNKNFRVDGNCPRCGKEMECADDILREEIQYESVMFHCGDCELLIGRHT